MTLQKRTSGEAMIAVICVLSALLVLSFSLLLSAGTLLANSGRTLPKEQCRVWASSLSRTLDAQITGGSCNFSSQSDEDAARDTLGDTLWFYLRDNMDTSWPYLNEEEPRHTPRYAERTFTFDTGNMPGLTDSARSDLGKAEVVLFWESENNEGPATNTPLTAEVTCWADGESCTITSRYQLRVEMVGQNAEDGQELPAYEQWSWSLESRG